MLGAYSTPRKRLFLEQDIQIESNLLQILDPFKIQKSSRLVLWSHLKSIATGEWMVCMERRSYNGSELGKIALIKLSGALEYIASRNVLGTNL